MVEDTGDFSKQSADELCSYGNIDVEQFLNSQRKTLLVGHPGGWGRKTRISAFGQGFEGTNCRQLIHRDVVQTIKVRQSLKISLILYQLLGASVQKPNVGISTDNLLSVQF